ncbi:DNA translocase FtsK [Carboxydochorda subterranea]|uniref:DNA translocase FtsK n=1 Tax=Carboxydichorda subterranea TaxID=3109565 RepID=A0ABZ1BUV4_9FIRM|nr:DNA translocase FtsK [Limnochorda sp. L945t]WRP16585.1 DNA translocase FtsK [Limnochorda sp. L945t]
MQAARSEPQGGARPADASELDRRILTGPDPFERRTVASAWEAPLEADVASIHAAETERLLQLVEAVRADRRTRSVMVVGQPGFGKTHLLGRLKARLRMPALFVYVTAFSDPERPYRHLIRQLVTSLEQQIAPGAGQQLAAVVRAVTRLDRRQLVARYPGIDLDVVRAVELLSHRRLWQRARSWLSGNEMDPQDVRALGLSHALATEEDVRGAIVTLARMLAGWGPVVMAWDQLESLASSPAEPGLAILGNRLMTLHDEAPNLLLVLACLDKTSTEAARVWPQSVQDRLAGEIIGLRGLTAEQAQQLCDLRMRVLYGRESPPWTAYPFRHEFFAELFRPGAAGPRKVLAECSDALRRMRALGQVVPIVAPGARTDEAPGKQPGPPEERPRELREALRLELAERARRKLAVRHPAARPPLPAEGAQVARTVQRLLDELGRRRRLAGGWRPVGAEVRPGPVRGQPPVVLVRLERDGKPLHVGIAVVDTTSGQSFARQMQALVQQLRDGRLDRGIVVRERRLGVPRGWKQGREYVRQWESLGGRVVEAGDETMAGLEALWSLLSEADSGDVALRGRPVEAGEALGHLVEDGAGEEILGELLQALEQVAGTATTTSENVAEPGREPSLPAPATAEREMAFSVSEAVAALACPRYFVLSQGRRPLTEVRRSFPLGATLHRMVADFVAHLPSAAAAPVTGESDGSPAPYPGEDAWVAVARRSLFDVWRRGEGRRVPEAEADRLWAVLERAVRFLCRLLAEVGREHAAGGGWWPLRSRRRGLDVRSEVPIERVVELGDGRRASVRGVADVVVRRRDGREVVVEFKTTPPQDAPLDLFQVALYSWLLEDRPGERGGRRAARRPSGAAAPAVEPVLVYVTPDGTVVRRFEGADVTATIEQKLRPFVTQLGEWARWRPGDPPPPASRLPGLCEACVYHPPCPDVFPPYAATSTVPAARQTGASSQETAASGEPVAGEVGTGETVDVEARPAGVSQPAELPVQARQLEEVLRAFGCDVRTVEVQEGPSFLRYKMAPESRTTVERIRSRAEDLKVRLNLPEEPMVDSVAGAIAVDVARGVPATVRLHQLLERSGGPAPGNTASGSEGVRQGAVRSVAIPLGVGLGWAVHFLDFADPNTPHLLVAGTTGSGKSVLLLSMAASIGALYGPDGVQLLLVDPKQVTFAPLHGSPFLLRPPVLDVSGILEALDQLIEEMRGRYARLSASGVQTVYDGPKPLAPPILCMVDEFATLVMTSRKSREAFEQRVLELASKGRAAGIHLVLTTQRPDSTVVSGAIKENLPARIALKVSSRVSSQVILDRPGAETLAGKGDMLFVVGSGQPVRLQAPYVTPEEARRYLRIGS